MSTDDSTIKIPIIAEADTAGFEAAQQAAEKTGQQVQQAAEQTIDPQRQAAEQIAETTRQLQEQQRAAAGGEGAEGSPKESGAQEAARSEQELQKAREASAASAEKAGDASAALAKQRAESVKSAADAAAAEKPLQAAREDTARAIATASEAQQEAANTAEAAATRSAKAADEEAEKMRALDAQMKLEAMAMRELTAEVQRLAAARQQAAKAGDAAQYQKLTEQLERTKKAYSDMKNAANLQKTAMMSQVNAGMQFANTLGSLSAQMKSGTVDVASLTNGVMSLGMALKAGLGPIGWVMMAIQGLQMAWDYYAESQKKAREKEKERLEAERAALEEHWEAVEKFSNKDREVKLDAWKKEIADVGKVWKDINDETNEKQRRANIEANAAAQRKRMEAQRAYDAEVAGIELARTRGEITEEEARKKKAAVEEVKAAEVAAIEETELNRTNKAHIEAKRRANYEADTLEQALNEKYGSFSEILKVQMPTNEEWEALQLKLQANEYSMQEYTASQEVTQKVAEIRRMLGAMGIAWKGSDAEIIQWVNSIRAARDEGEKMVKSLRSTAESEGAAALESKLRLDMLKAQNKADAERRARTEELEEAKHTKAEEEKKLSEEWAEMQRKSLTEQEKWLSETAGSFRAGSEEAKRWARELRNVRAKQVTDAAGEVEKQYKVTGHYVERDARTQAAIHAADEKALLARKEALAKLKASPNVDASTLKAINQKIKDTDAQLRGLRQAMRQSALEAQKAVVNLRPLGQQAKTKSLQPALRKAEKAYVSLAKRAERQAAKGDDKGLERTMAAMRKNAAAQEKMTGYTGRAAAHWKTTEGQLRAIAKGTTAENRGLTYRQRNENKILQALGQKEKWHARQNKADAKTARAKEDEAEASQQSAKNAKNNARQSKPAQQASKTAQLATEVSDLRAQMAKMEEAQARMGSNMGGLSAAVGKLAAAAERTASIAGKMASAATSALGRLENKNTALDKAVDRLARKIS